ncbi:hypothetical protein K438DRAFT_1970224 [Mycena galopus ATCC 62051]|nr:hypothetical protein K438DRAFT_1970224 [Mycena galopus ATCC 62051]
MEPFLASLGPSITSLELRNVCVTMFRKLVSYGDILATYEHLSSLKMDITEGVWDWDGRGSPNSGASADYIFHSLRIPALRRFELIVGDLTILVSPADFRMTLPASADTPFRNWYMFEDTIRLFEGLSAAYFCALTHLEIKDSNTSANRRLSWGYVEGGPFERARYFPGIISFLNALRNLSSLWYATAGSFLYRDPECAQYNGPDWDPYHEDTRLVLSLRDILSRLESLQVGFGAMDHTEVEHVLAACDPAKLRQFGFEWAWDKYGHADRISPDLLVQLTRFPKLTDVHILFPRPETQVSGARDPTIDGMTLGDVTAIFACNASICRVGIRNSVVWERQCGPQSVGTAPGIIFIGDGSSAPNHAVPAFYHAGYMAKYRPGETFKVYDDKTTPLRPERGEEIEQLRDLLKRILE